VGVVPLGTGNDLARSLGLYRGRRWSVGEVLAYLGTTRTQAVDLWSIRDNLTFSNYASIGLDATVVRDFCRVRRWIQAHPALGKRGVYFAMYILVWGRRIGDRIPPQSCLSWVDGEGNSRSITLEGARVLAFTNTPYYAAGALMDPRGLVGDGLVEITLFPHMRHYAELMAMRIPAFARGGIQRHWWRAQARSAEIRVSEPICVQADGEDLTDPLATQSVLAIRKRGQVQVLVW
jgi:diacylglycerol kinase family enzyme